MPKAGQVSERKVDYVKRFIAAARGHKNALVCEADMVTSKQMQAIRIALRGRAVLMMGKNTLMRKALRAAIVEVPQLERLNSLVRGNCGVVFTNEDLSSIRQVLIDTRVESAARVGVYSPCDVTIKAALTTLQPTETSFLQGLGFVTKINKGAIEILEDKELLKEGDKVGANEVSVLAKLNIKPFMYGLSVRKCYEDGVVFDPAVLDLTTKDIAEAVADMAHTIAAIGLQVGYATVASVPHTFNHTLKELVAIALEADYDIPAVAAIKEAIANPQAFAAAVAPAAAAAAPAKAAAAAPAKVEEEEEGDFGLGLFD